MLDGYEKEGGGGYQDSHVYLYRNSSHIGLTVSCFLLRRPHYKEAVNRR